MLIIIVLKKTNKNCHSLQQYSKRTEIGQLKEMNC